VGSTRGLSLALLIAAAGIAHDAAADTCGIGGYQIHTIAPPKKPDPKRVFLLYHRGESGETLAEAAADEEALPAIGGPLRIEFGAAACTAASGLTPAPELLSDETHSARYAYRFSVQDCASLARDLPDRGYLLLDTVAKTIRFPRQMQIDEPPTPAAERKEIAAFVKEDLESRILYLFTDGDQALGRIAPDSIDGRRAVDMAIGRGPHRLVVHVEILRIKGLGSAWIGRAADELTPPDLRIASGKADFPVLYFQHPSRSHPIYIGDGSMCSDDQYEKYPEPQDGAEGSFDRFRITGAFDFDQDGTADVLEVNDRFAYWIDTTGMPEVIQYGLGC
jgi:hypothetical protein